MISDGKNGFIINPDKEELFKVFHWVLKSKIDIPGFKKYSKELIKKFSLTSLTNNIENLFNTVI